MLNFYRSPHLTVNKAAINPLPSIIRASRRDALVKHYSDVHQTTPRTVSADEAAIGGGDVASNVVVDGIFDL